MSIMDQESFIYAIHSGPVKSFEPPKNH